MKFDTVIFDLDGTLLDTLHDLSDSLNAALAAFGHPPHSPEVCQLLVGSGHEKLIRRAVPGPLDDAHALELAGAFADEYGRRFLVKTRPYDGIPPLVDGLCGMGLNLAVVTNKMEDIAKKLIDRFFPGKFRLVFGDLAGRPRKPDPGAVLSVVSAFHTDRDRVLFVGDSCVDMQTAGNAGICSAGVLWGFRSEDELRQNGARHIVSSPAQILGIVSRGKA